MEKMKKEIDREVYGNRSVINLLPVS